jgi:general secretion pathway protein I
MRLRQQQGFTLIEVLVALSIVGIALIAGFKATGALTHNAQRQSAQLLGQLCAENALVSLRLLHQIPGIGETKSICTQGGQSLEVTRTVQATPNPNFVRVDVQVSIAVGQTQEPVMRLSTLLGRN